MGEFIGTVRAFAAELSKSIGSLPPASSTSYQDHLERTKIGRTIMSSIEYYSAKLTASYLLPNILETAEKLLEQGHHTISKDLHGYVSTRCPLAVDGTDLGLTKAKALEFEVRSTLGVGISMGLQAIYEDRDLCLPDTLLKVRKSYEILRRGISQALELEEHYWLVLNGTQHIHEISRLVFAAGQAAEALPYLVFAALSLESNIRLSLPKFLPWRCDVYAAAVECYHQLGSIDEALRFVDHGLSRVHELEELQKLDPLPCPQDILDAYESARILLTTLRFSLSAYSFKSEAEAQALLDKHFHHEEMRIRALCVAVRTPKKFSEKPELTDGLKFCMKLLDKRATPLFMHIQHGLAARTKQYEHDAKVAALRPTSSSAVSLSGDAAAEGGAAAPEEVPALVLNHEETEGLNHLDHALRAIAAPLHVKIVADAYKFKETALFEKAVSAAKLRTAPDGDLPTGGERLTYTAELLTALHAFEGITLTFPNLAPALPLADALLAHLPLSAVAVGDILADAALTLYHATKPLVNRWIALNLPPDQTLERVLQALYGVFAATNISDPLIFTDTAIKFGLVLEIRGEINLALNILKDTRVKVESYRSQMIEQHRHDPHEPFYSFTGDRSQPTEELAGLVEGMTEQERTLACLHFDLLILLTRMELKVGLIEQEIMATKKVAKLEETMKRRDDQAAIFGKRTEKERREDGNKLVDAAKTPSNPRATEKRLLAEADRNLYEKAVILMTMAEFREQPGKEQCLRECLEVLHQLEKSEANLFKTIQTAMSSPVKAHPVPPVPLFVSRTLTSLTITPPRGFRVKGDGRPTQYAIYGKAFGAGTSVQMNAIATQHENLGIKFALNERCTVRGLKPNDSYTFAIAYFDDQGRVLGELGASSPEIPMVLPIPLYYLWSKLVVTAYRLGVVSVARPACSVVWRHFVISRSEKPIWDANPTDEEDLHPLRAAVACPPILREFAKSSYLWSERIQDSDGSASGNSPFDADPLKRSYQDSQVAILKRAKRIIIGLESATLVGDEGLICEGAVRLYNCLGPLIAQTNKSRLLTKGLLACYTALQSVLDVTWCKRSLAGSVAIRLVYHLVDLCDEINETGLRDLVVKTSLPLIDAVRSYREGPQADVEKKLGSISDDEKALLDLQSEELRHLTEFLLQHKDAGSMGAAGGLLPPPEAPPVAEGAKKDAKAAPAPAAAHAVPYTATQSDFMMKILQQIATEPKGGLAELMNTLMNNADVRNHPRYIEAVYRICERAHHRHMHAQVKTWVEHIFAVNKEHCQPAAPPLPRIEPLVLQPEPKPEPEPGAEGEPQPEEPEAEPEEPIVSKIWTLEMAIAVMKRNGVNPPEAEVELAGSLEKYVAAKFIQSRWKPCLARIRAVKKTRAHANRNGCWVARAASLQAFSCAHAARDTANVSIADAADIAKGMTARVVEPPKPDPAVPVPPAKKGAPPPPPVEVPIPDPEQTLLSGYADVMACLQAISRASEWSARSGFPWELMNNCKRLHNLIRQLLPLYKDLLLQPVEKGYWAIQTVDGATIPISHPLPAAPTALQRRESKVNMLAGRAPSRTMSGRALSTGQSIDDQDLQGLEDQVEEERDEGPPPGRLIMVPAAANPVRLLRVSVGRLLELIERLKSGTVQMYTAMLPTQNLRVDSIIEATFPSNMNNVSVKEIVMHTVGASNFLPTMTAAGRMSSNTGAANKRPVTAASAFSFGSDLVPELWYTSVPSLDIKWASKFVMTIVGMAQQTGFHGTVFTAGDRFNRLTEGHMALDILPPVKQACAILGINLVPYQLALEAAIRDKNQALEELDKCRGLVKQKFADRSPCSFEKDRMQKKKKRNVNFKEGASVRGSQSQYETGSQANKGGAASLYSAQTSRSNKSGPDTVNIPQQYKKVIEILEAKGEKWLKAQALNELGDAHAHQSEWNEAAIAWSDALDLMMGPYQSVKNWRTDIGHMSPREFLARYGAQRILLALVLLGKLAHLVYVNDLTSRLECAALGAELAHALFTCSAMHPQRKLDFAGYRCTDIWVGQDLFCDPYQCPLFDLQFSAEALSRILLANDLALDSMPLICLMDHVSRVVTRDPPRVAKANLLRVEACCMEGRLREASAALFSVVLGIDLPDPVTGMNQAPPSTDQIGPGANNASSGGGPLYDKHLYDSSQRPSHPQNSAVIEKVLNLPLHEQLAKSYGREVVGLIQIARARFVYASCKESDLFCDCDHVSGNLKNPVVEEAPPPPAPVPDKKGQLKGKEASKKNLKEEKPDPKNKKRASAVAENEPAPVATGLFVGDVASFEGQSLQAAVALLHTSLTSLREFMGSTQDKKTMAALAFVAVQSEMSLSDLRHAQMLPAQALNHATQALATLANESGPYLAINGEKIASEPPEFIMRFALLSEPWCMTVARLVELTYEMGQVERAMAAIESGIEAAMVLRCDRLSNYLQCVRARCYLAQGRTLEGLREIQALEGKMKRAFSPPLEIATLRFQGAEVLDALGLRADSADQYAQATVLLRQHLTLRGLYSPPTVPYAAPAEVPAPSTTGAAPTAGAPAAPAPAAPAAPADPHQLQNRRRFEEILSLTVPGSALFVECLLRESRAQFRRKRFQLATDLAREALDVTPRARLPPQTHAACALQLAHCMRHLVASSSDDKESALEELAKASNLLHCSIRWAALDGGHPHDHLHRCYCELALVQLQRCDIFKSKGATAEVEDARARALGAVSGALKVAGQRDRLLLSPQTLQGFKLEDAPVWALETLRGRELAKKAVGPRFDPTNADVVGPLLVKHLIALTRKTESFSWDLEITRRVQLCMLHRFLRSACPQYQAECCLTAAAVQAKGAPATGLTIDGLSNQPSGGLKVAFVWHEEPDGCLGPGAEDSWSAEGSLDNLTDKKEGALIGLTPPPPWVHLIAAVVPAQGALGVYEGACPLIAAHDLQKAAQDMRLKVEAEAAGSEESSVLTNGPPATAATLAQLVQNLQVLILQTMGKRARGAPNQADHVKAAGEGPPDATRLRQIETLLDLTRGGVVTETVLAETVAEVYRSCFA